MSGPSTKIVAKKPTLKQIKLAEAAVIKAALQIAACDRPQPLIRNCFCTPCSKFYISCAKLSSMRRAR